MFLVAGQVNLHTSRRQGSALQPAEQQRLQPGPVDARDKGNAEARPSIPRRVIFAGLPGAGCPWTNVTPASDLHLAATFVARIFMLTGHRHLPAAYK
jgi:hypothetical protein